LYLKRKPFKVLPLEIIPITKIPYSLTTHSVDENVSFRIGKIIGRISSLNTLARLPKAAALNVPIL